MHTICGWILLLTLLQPSEDVKVSVLKVSEARQKKLTPRKPTDGVVTFGGDTPLLKITMEMQGSAAEKAIKYGYITITQAKDDQGRALKPIGGFGGHPSEDFEKIDREHMYFFEDEKPKDKIKFDLVFEPSDRTAKQVALIEGKVKLLAIGQEQKIIFEKITTLGGQELQHEALTAIGLKMKVVKPSDDQSKSVTLDVSGPEDGLLDLRLIDGEGKEISTSRSTMSMWDQKQISLDAWEGMPEGAKLELTVGSNPQSVEVPFKLEKIDLP